MKPTPRKDQIDLEEDEKHVRSSLRDGSSPHDAKTSKSAGKNLRGSTPDEDGGPKGAGRLG